MIISLSLVSLLLNQKDNQRDIQMRMIVEIFTVSFENNNYNNRKREFEKFEN